MSFEHRQLVDRLTATDRVPNDESEIAPWLRGDAHLQLLRDDARGSELMIAALTSVPGPTRINSYIVPGNLLESQEGTLPFADWSPNPYHHTAARYSWGSSSHGVVASFGSGGMGGPLPSGVSPFVFFRSGEGMSAVSREVAQDFIHAANAYWQRGAKGLLKARSPWRLA